MPTDSEPSNYEQARSLALVLLKAHSIPTLQQIENSVQRALSISDNPERINQNMLIREIQSRLNYLVPANTDQNIKHSLEAYKFEVGKQYRRRDIYRTIGISEDTKGGNWDTGYSSFGDDWFIFCNIGIPGRTGHDYENAWQGENLLWFGKTNTKLSHPAMQLMLRPKGQIYIFTRSDSSTPFTFAGCGRAKDHKDTSPVTILWELHAPG